MSVHLTSRVWRIEGLKPMGKLVLLKLADNANDDGVGWPSVGRICRETGASRPTVQRWIGAFEKAGWLTRKQREDSSNVYTLTLPQSEAAPPAPERGPATQGGPPLPQSEAPPATQGGTEPSLNRQPEPSKGDFSKNFGPAEAAAVILAQMEDEHRQHESFALRLGEFMKYRFRGSRKMTHEAARRLGLKLKTHDADTCATALENSLERGWSGVFPDSVKKEQPGELMSAGTDLMGEGVKEDEIDDLFSDKKKGAEQ